MYLAKIIAATALSFAIAIGAVFADEQSNIGPTPFLEMGSWIKDLNVEDIPEVAPGIHREIVWGDPASGPFGMIMWVAPGSPGEMHAHTNPYFLLVIQGGIKHWEKGETEADALLLGPGDSYFQPGGIFHLESFPTDEYTMTYVQYAGPADLLITPE